MTNQATFNRLAANATAVNAAMIGEYTCPCCKRDGLYGDEMRAESTANGRDLHFHEMVQKYGSPVCHDCADNLPYMGGGQEQSGYVPCDKCAGNSRANNARVYDRVRGVMVNNWCVRCDGYGRVFVGEVEGVSA